MILHIKSHMINFKHSVPATYEGIKSLFSMFPFVEEIIAHHHNFQEALNEIVDYLSSHHMEAWVSQEPIKKSDTSDSDYLYHVTTLANASKIGRQGLRPQGAKGIGAAGLGSHKAEHVFLTSGQGVPFWHSRAVDFAEHYHDDPAGSYHIPVVLRIHKDKLRGLDVQPDELGSKDARQPAFKVKGQLRGEDFEHWDGNQWSKVGSTSLMNPAFAALGHDKDGYLLGERESKLVPPEHMRKIESIKKSNPLDPLIQQAKANIAMVNKVAAQNPRPMLFGNKKGNQHGFVSVDPSKPNQWRITHFVKGEPSGHTEAVSFSDAIKKAHSSGYDVSKELSEEDMNKTEDLEKTLPEETIDWDESREIYHAIGGKTHE